MKIKDVKVMKHTKPNRDHVYALTECGRIFVRDICIRKGSADNLDGGFIASEWIDITEDLPTDD